MGTEKNGKGQQQGSEHEDDDDDDEGENTFTQADLDRTARGIRKSATASARQALVKELGFEDPEELKEFMRAAKELVDGKGDGSKDEKKTDGPSASEKALERRLKDLEKQLNDGNSEKAKSSRENLLKDVALALVDEGLNAKAARRIAKLAEVEVGADEDDIAEAIEALKVDMPEVFKKTDADDDGEENRKQVRKDKQKAAPKDSNPGGSTRQPKRNANSQTAARARLDRLHPNRNKS